MKPAVLAVLVLAAAAPHPAAAADWRIDPDHSRLTFRGTQGGVSFEGRFTRFAADIAFDPAAPETGRVVVRIDMTSAATGDRQKDEALPQPEWFDARAFPEARFEASGFHAVSGGFEAPGRLILRGVEKPLVLPFRFERNGDAAHAAGRVDLRRGDFGVGQGPWASEQWVGGAVEVAFDLTVREIGK